MPREESSYPDDWFGLARREYLRSQRLLEMDDFDGAAFHLQQSLEKYLKGFLLSKGWKLRRTHDLEVLLNEAARYEPSLHEFADPCIAITEYYLQDRYPFVGTSSLIREDIEPAFAAATRLISILLDALGKKSQL
jgi:HEPN domain-containing protein